jgi:hypothetical protein
VALENGDLIAARAEPDRGGEPAEAGADDQDMPTAGRLAGCLIARNGAKRAGGS